MRICGLTLVLACVVIAPAVGQSPDAPANRPFRVADDLRVSEKPEPVESDRDAFTPQTRTLEKGRFVLESSYTFLDHKKVAETHSYPEMLLRYGLTKRVELRVGWNFEVGGSGNDVSGSQSDLSLGESETGSHLLREYHVIYGFKVGATRQENWIPESSVIVMGRSPVGTESGPAQWSAAYVFGWKLPNRWKTDFAVRYLTAEEEGDHFNTWSPSAVLRVPLGERWMAHAEYFGVFSQGKSAKFGRNYFSPGVHYLITNNVEVGVRVGWGLNADADRFFANAGFGLRF